MDFKKLRDGIDHVENENKKYNTRTTRKAILVTTAVVLFVAIAVKLFL